MAATSSTLVVRKTFLDLEEEAVEEYECRPRAMTDSILASSGFWADAAEKSSGSDSLSAVETTDPSCSGSWAECESPRSSAPSDDVISVRTSFSEPVEPEEFRTTVLIRGLSEGCTRNQFRRLLESHGFRNLVDFVYVPIDLLTMEHCGFGFANFVSVAAAQRAFRELQGVGATCAAEPLVLSWSEKDQGLALLVDRHRNSPLMHASIAEEHRPLLLQDGVPVTFPAPTRKIRLQSLMQQLRRRQRASADAETAADAETQ